MSTVGDWEKRINDFLGEIAGDDCLNDRQYLDVLEELKEQTSAMIVAKREELREGDSWGV